MCGILSKLTHDCQVLVRIFLQVLCMYFDLLDLVDVSHAEDKIRDALDYHCWPCPSRMQFVMMALTPSSNQHKVANVKVHWLLSHLQSW